MVLYDPIDKALKSLGGAGAYLVVIPPGSAELAEIFNFTLSVGVLSLK